MQQQENIVYRTAPPVTPGHRYEKAVECILKHAPLSEKQRTGITRLKEQPGLTPLTKLVSATALLVAGPDLNEVEFKRATISNIAGQWLYRSMNGHRSTNQGAAL